MKQYTLYLLGGEAVVLGESSFASFLEAYKTSGDLLIHFSDATDQDFYIARAAVTHIISEEVSFDSKVVMPVTPNQLRDEKQKALDSIPVTLEEQLNNVEEDR